MKGSIRPTKSGGIVATGRGEFAAYSVEWDSSGQIVSNSIEFGSPLSEPKRAAGCGDLYSGELHDRLGGIPCGACDKERRRMNGMTVAECRAEREAIIEGTIERAKGSTRWWDRIRATVGDTLAPDELRRIIGECFDRAMENAETAAESRDP